MGGRFSDTVLNAVRERVDILDLIQSYVALRQRGANWIGLCPFHDEKTPSFNVNPDRAMFKCFGCGEGGDAIKFLMRMEGMAFPDAVEELALRASVEIQRTAPSPQQVQEQDQRKRMATLNAWASGWFRDVLRSPAGSSAREHIDARGLAKETLDTYDVGAAPDAWDELSKGCARKGGEADGVAAGLLIRSDSGRVYDRLRNRVVFPIRDVRGRVIGFGGRTLGDDSAKYLNSPDTALYHKSSVLYGLYEARLAIGKADLAIICEGYFDVLAVADAGLTNTVATCGTALTTDQIRLLKRYSRNVALLFDSDEAGRTAARKALDLFLDHDMWPTRVVLPDTKDPDEFLRKHGAEALRRVIADSPPLLDVVVNEACDDFAGDVRAPTLVLERLASVFNRLLPTQQGRILELVARRLARPARDVEREWQTLRQRIRAPRSAPAREQISEAPVGTLSSRELPRMEARLVRWFLTYPQETAHHLLEQRVIEQLEAPEVASYLSRGIAYYDEHGTGPEPGTLLDERSGGALERLVAEVALAANSEPPRPEDFRSELAECLIRIEIADLERKVRDRELAIVEAMGQPDRDRDYERTLIAQKTKARIQIRDLQVMLRTQQASGGIETRLTRSENARTVTP